MLRAAFLVLFFALQSIMLQAGTYCYRLMLDGKPGSALTQLSERAMQRRERLGIMCDSADYEVSPLYQQQLVEAGLQIITRSRWLNSVVVQRRDGEEIEEAFWQQFPFIIRHELVSLLRSEGEEVPPRFEPLEGSRGSASSEDTEGTESCQTPLEELNALQPLYEAGHRGQGMLIAVLDGGFCNIDKFNWLMDKVVGCCNMYNPTDSTSIFNDEMHGACCFSIMASSQEHGVFGTAQEASYYLINTEDGDYEHPIEEDMWVAGAEVADSIGADLISSSLGYFEFDNPFTAHHHDQFATDEVFISRGARIACKKGMLVCNAAGNEAEKAWSRIIFPSDVEEVLSVGGTTPSLTPARFSSIGFTQPFVKPDVACRATNCYVINANSPDGEVNDRGAGTSFATPLMCGLVASLWSAVPSLTPAQIRQVVRASANLYDTPDIRLGYGMPDFGLALTLARQLCETESSIEIVNTTHKSSLPSYYNLQGQRLNTNQLHGICISNGQLVNIR